MCSFQHHPEQRSYFLNKKKKKRVLQQLISLKCSAPLKTRSTDTFFVEKVEIACNSEAFCRTENTRVNSLCYISEEMHTAINTAEISPFPFPVGARQTNRRQEISWPHAVSDSSPLQQSPGRGPDEAHDTKRRIQTSTISVSCKYEVWSPKPFLKYN